MQQTHLIRTSNRVETPAAGHWPLGVGPSVSVARGRRGAVPARAVSGALVVGDETGDIRLQLTIATPAPAPGRRGRALAAADTQIELVARSTGHDLDGHWTFVGDVTIDGAAVAAVVDASYRGVFRRRSRAWTELALETSFVPAGWTRGQVTIRADVIFDAPTSATEQAPERLRLAA
jgi:hypothetical protein